MECFVLVKMPVSVFISKWICQIHFPIKCSTFYNSSVSNRLFIVEALLHISNLLTFLDFWEGVLWMFCISESFRATFLHMEYICGVFFLFFYLKSTNGFRCLALCLLLVLAHLSASAWHSPNTVCENRAARVTCKAFSWVSIKSISVYVMKSGSKGLL